MTATYISAVSKKIEKNNHRLISSGRAITTASDVSNGRNHAAKRLRHEKNKVSVAQPGGARRFYQPLRVISNSIADLKTH